MDNRRRFIKRLSAAGLLGIFLPDFSFANSADNNIHDALLRYDYELPDDYTHTLVKAQRALAEVVIADNATPTARYAAKEFVDHVELATGVQLNIISESDTEIEGPSYIYIGRNDVLPLFKVDPDDMEPESYLIRSIGRDVFIFGREDNEDPLDRFNSNVGTLFGVYEFLENYLNVRWLWPGELGTFAPEVKDILVPAQNKLGSLSLRFREIAWRRIRNVIQTGKYEDIDARFGFSPTVAQEYGKALQIFLRRHRMGGMDNKPPSSHNFRTWWKRYGKEHPEWFALRKDGIRGDPDPEAIDIPLCITNEELQDFIIDQWDGKDWLVLGPMDRPGRCNCEVCRSWDPPQPDHVPWFAEYIYGTSPRAKRANKLFSGVTSHRYSRFWKVMQQKAENVNQQALISVSYLYENELPAPSQDVKLNKYIYGEFVQWQDPHLRWFPMPREAFEWIKKQWLGWKDTGLRMGYRPNYLHDGYVMPLFETEQSGNFIKFAFENGMEGARFDSLTGQWAVQGLRLYMHFRLMTNPDLEISEIKKEYFQAFGPAATIIHAYMDYWENYAFDHMEKLVDLFHNPPIGWRYVSFPKKVHEAFPPEAFEPAYAILDEAISRVAENSEYKQRIDFLRIGLDHAVLVIELAGILNGNRQPADDKKEAAENALKKLIEFRKENQASFFSDLLHVTNFWEIRVWDLDEI